eukprot:TRINITY_DN29693_c0_g1_i1.p1 TRINITY_DN29693_c0_g1~~TRINITY_DN29693_c0_g1_i1.p1  ORF type:complete len:533 (+),score=91.55 TRINITY_DN29693_c0_g1_i1:222-1601(+)
MATEVILQDSTGISVSHGLALLDVVKHALLTIVNILEDQDRLSIVAYSTEAVEILAPTPMTEDGRRAAQQGLEQMIAEGFTNLWSGLEKGIDILSKSQEPGRLQHVLLLTDGIPTYNPPRGIVSMLERLKNKGPGGKLPCTVSTFGFGNELDSELLNQISTVGCGSYAYIPDAGFIGTVFVNSVSNLLVTMGTCSTLVLEIAGEATLERSVIDLGSLQFGQHRDAIVRIKLTGSGLEGVRLRATLKYRTCEGVSDVEVASELCLADAKLLEEQAGREEAGNEVARTAFVDGGQEIMKMLKQTKMDIVKKIPLPIDKAQNHIQALEEKISSIPDIDLRNPDGPMSALLEDLCGQVAEAVSKEEWFTKWGRHFLPSLICAHRSQQCNNFKDPGVQHYGGQLFQDIRDKADETFLSLPAPKPTPRPTPEPPASRAAAAPAPPPRPVPAAPVSMAVFHDRYGG